MTSSPGIPSLSQAFATAFNSLLFNSHGMVINSGPISFNVCTASRFHA